MRGTKDVKEIGEHTVEEEVQYLGIKIGGSGRDIFRAEKRMWLEKAKKKANEVIPQIKKSFDKVIVGKAIWKLMMVPGLLFGKAVVVTAKTTIEKIQRIENRVWKYLLGLGGYTTVESLRGEIGASMMISRIMETMLLYVIDTLSSNFENLKMYMNDGIEKGKGQWINTINDYRMKLDMSWDDLRNIDRKSLKDKIKEYDTQMWLQGMFHKPTLKWYRMGKEKIEYEMCYRNNNYSAYLAKARTNSLQLEEHLGRGLLNYDTTCKLCGQGEKTWSTL